MAEVASAFVSLLPSLRGFGGKLEGGLGPELDRAGKKGGKRFSGAMSGILGGAAAKMFAPLAAAAGGIAVGDFLKDAVGEARESQKVGALTTSIIKSTGGAAKITADQVGDLATSISNKTGMDDEAIQSGANLLLTFKNVRNEVGKGNDVFNQATQAAADLSAAGFGDLNGASKMLGKALNDPVKGMSALGRAGVTFTDAQKKQVAAMVKSGDVLGAQKIILGEVKSQVGGAAAASATAGEKLSVAWGNFKEQIGTALLPIIDKVAGFLTTKVIPAVSNFFAEMQSGKGAGGAFVGFLKGIWTAVQPIGKLLMETVVPAVQNFITSFTKGGGASQITGLFTTIGNAVRGIIPVVVTFVTGTLLPLFRQAVAFIQTQVIPRVMGIVGAIRGFYTVAIPIVQQFVSGMIARIQPLMPQIRSIFSTIGTIITGALDLVKAIIERVTTVISFVWRNWGQGIMNVIASVWSGVLGVIQPALNVIKSVIQTVTSVIKGDWSGAWAGIKGIVSNVLGVIKGVVSGGLGVLRTMFGGVMTKIGSAVTTGLGNVVKWFSELPGRILGGIGDLAGKLFNYGVNTIQGFINGIASMAGQIIATVRDKVIGVLPDFVKDFLGIHSPSRVFAELGKWTGLGLAVGIAGTQKQVVGKMEKLVQALAASGKKGLTAYARGVERQLSAHAARRDAITARLTAAQAKLKGLQADSAKYAADARQRVVDTGSVVGMNSFGNIVAGLKRSVTQAKSFATVLGQLRAQGLNKTSLDQIIQAGPAEGLAAAQQLLKGGKGGIGQVNSLVSQLSTSAGSVGKQASDAMYGAGINAAKGLVRGLQSQQAAITKTMTGIAKTMVTQIKAALKIKSPSRVFMQIGSFTGQGMAIGIGKQASSVQSAADSLVPTLNPGRYTSQREAITSARSQYLRLHPHDMKEIVAGFAQSRPVASLDEKSVQRGLVKGMP